MKKPAAQKSALKKNGGLDSTSTEAGSVLADSVGSSSSADELPGKKEIAAVQATVRAFMNSRRQARVRSFLERLSGSPPQVLLLEGGTADDRLAAAHYWSLLLNCPTATGWTAPDPRPGSADEPPAPAQGGLLNLLPGVSPGGQAAKAPQAVLQGMVKEDSLTGVCAPDRGVPCLDCPECIRLLTHLHRDCFFFDGLAGSIKIDEVRAMRVVLGEPAREARHRVVIFREAQSLVEAAANALLKSFEEPRPGTSFVLLAPQRERLLPTLVSRSFVLTLPWKREADPEQRESLAPWEAALCTFLRTGRDFLERSAGKGAVDAALVQIGRAHV